jgi:putative colanic acid biosynthesis glycosyltransferase
MKICILNTKKIHGGASIVALDLAKGMARNGHEVIFVCSDQKNDSFYQDGYRVILLKQTFRSPVFHYFNPELLLKLMRIMKSFNPDIINLHNLNQQTFSLSTLFYSLKYPTLWTLHDVWALCVTGWPENASCDRMINACKGCQNWPLWMVMINRFIKEICYKHARFSVVFPSSWIKKLSSNSNIIRKKSFIVNNGIDEKEFISNNNVKTKITKEQPTIILYCGGRTFSGKSPTLRKGWIFFLKAIEAVYNSGRNIKVLYVGDPIKIPVYVKVPIEFTGAIERREMGRFYALSDIFVLPTLGDNFPLTILEAMACKTAVIATSVGGIPEIIEDGVSGILCNARDSKSLAKAINLLIDNPEIRMEMVQTAFDRFAEKFTLQKMVEGYINAYDITINEFKRHFL